MDLQILVICNVQSVYGITGRLQYLSDAACMLSDESYS